MSALARGGWIHEVREYDAVMAMREYTGFGYMKLSQRTGIPESTVGHWARGDKRNGNPRTRKQRWEEFGAQPLPATRRCTRCREIKDRTEFSICFRRRTGNAYLFSHCKQCVREKQDERRRADPEAHRRRSREAHRARRAAKRREPRVNAEPLLRYIEPWTDEDRVRLLRESQRQVLSRARRSGVISHRIASDVLTMLGEPGAMRQLYGEA